MQSAKADALRFQMDKFEVPFDDPEILRDGDTIEVHLDQEAVEVKEEPEAEGSGVSGEAKPYNEAPGALRPAESHMDEGEDQVRTRKQRKAKTQV